MRPLHIYTEGDQQRGLGHLTRCSAYAKTWEDAGGDIVWYVDGDHLVEQQLNTQQVILGKWQNSGTVIAKQDAIALVDSYSAPLDRYQYISNQYRKSVFLDDTYRLDYPKGLAIHAAPGAIKNMSGGATWVYGPKWQPLRPAFWNIPKRTIINEEVKNILIMLGGTDIRNMTSSILDLTRRLYPTAHIHTITSAPASLDENCTQYSFLTAENIAALMSKCDLAVSAAGQTIYELAATGTPAILICTAENQKIQIDGWKEFSCFHYAGEWSDSDIYNKISTHLVKLSEISIRRENCIKLQNIVDGSGTKRWLEWMNL